MKIPETMLLEVLHKETGIAVGCTEVAAVALAAAWAAKALGRTPERIEIVLDRGTYKNGMRVGIPGTREVGVPWAAAIGACVARPEEELRVLGNLSPEVMALARPLVLGNRIQVSVNRMAREIYILCKMTTDGSTSEALITSRHDQVDRVLLNNRAFKGWKGVKKTALRRPKRKVDIRQIPFDAFIPFVQGVSIEKLAFLDKGLDVNRSFAKECLNHLDELDLSPILKSWGVGPRKSRVRPDEYGKLITTAAVEARMKGFPAPVFTCGGSGNQGLVASLPLIGYAENAEIGHDLFLRSVALSFLVSIYIKAYTGVLSPICGCGIGAAIGVGCGIAYVLGGRDKEIEGVIKNMVGTMAGIICDGAKSGCAFKALLMVGMAFDSAKLAVAGVIIASRDGILSQSVEETLANLEHLANFGMAHADEAIIDVMTRDQ